MNEILNINNVHGYLDKKDGTAYLNAGDVARGFGFTKTETKNGVKYESVRWARVNEYLSSFGFRPNVGEDDYLPENMVYRLGFKASNDAAKKFQAVLADEVLPAIRRHGAYMTDQALERAITEPDFLIRLATQLKEEQIKRNKSRPLSLPGQSVPARHPFSLVSLPKYSEATGSRLARKGYSSGCAKMGI